LDTKTSIDVMALFQDIWHAGLTIVFLTHEPGVARYASRILVVRDGAGARSFLTTLGVIIGVASVI
jgi:ABC-type lipoprotein export system ATPase subunit